TSMPDCRRARSPAPEQPRCAPHSGPLKPITCTSSPGRTDRDGMSFQKTSRRTARPPLATAVALRSKSKKQRLEDFLRERQLAAIAEEDWRELVALLAPVSENYLRELL